MSLIRQRSVAVLVTLGVVAAVPAAAQGAVVSSENTEGGAIVFIRDTSALADRLVLAGRTDTSIVVKSPDNAPTPVTAGPGCTQTAPATVECPGTPNVVADLGGGNDELSGGVAVGSFVTINGGDGADRIVRRSSVDGTYTFNGGAGNDLLVNDEEVTAGNANPMTLRGDAGNDVLDLSGRSLYPDVAHGGSGIDLVTYARRGPGDNSDQYSLDGVANDGGRMLSPPESDNIQPDVENLTGTFGGDVITGSAAANVLRGGPGPGGDLIDGLAGDDVIAGDGGGDVERGGDGDDMLGGQRLGKVFTIAPTLDTGIDRFFGGGGSDVLLTADGTADLAIDCGTPGFVEFGGDSAIIDLPDQTPTGCETIERAAKDQHPTVDVRSRTLRVRDGAVRVRVSCPRTAPGRRGCRGTMRLVQRRRTLGRARYRVRRGRSATVEIELRRGARKRRAEIRTSERDTRGRPETTSSPVRLR